jgi:hypothetical protein
MHFDQGILYGIGCSFLSTQDLLGETMGSGLILLHQVAEGEIVAEPGSIDQIRHVGDGSCAAVAREPTFRQEIGLLLEG